MLEKYLNDPVVYAEEDGIVDEIKNDETGVLLKKDTTVIRIQSRSGYALKIKVTQSELENISLGQSAEVTFDSDDAVKGSVGHINYKANDNGTFEVTIAMENSDGMLSNVYPGVTGKVTIELDKKEDVLRVPLEAVKQDNDGEYVMVYTGDSKDIAEYDVSTIPMEKRYIERGATNSLFAEVLSGLRGDEKVVIAKTSADSGALSFLSGNTGQ
jgi:multidrug efflux pump subunit AcrA (membrane-fusion protein)